MRLIDADAFRKLLVVDKYGQINTTITKINIAIEKAKVDAEPVKHAEPILNNDDMNNYYVCSNCKHDVDFWVRYCPYCGAKMDDEISNIAKESADKISKALEKVKAKGWQTNEKR